MENLTKRFSLHRFKARLLLVSLYMNYWLTFFETFFFRGFTRWNFQGTGDLCRLIQTSLEKYPRKDGFRGIVALSAHLGNFEVTGMVLAKCFGSLVQRDFYALAKPSRLSWITRFMDRIRTSGGIKILWTDKRELVRNMMNALRGGSGIGLLNDQKPANGGVFISLFGEYACFPVAGVDIGIRSEAIILHVTSARILPWLHRFLVCEGNNSHLASSVEVLPAKNYAGRLWDKTLSPKELRTANVLASYAEWLERARALNCCMDKKRSSPGRSFFIVTYLLICSVTSQISEGWH